MKQKQIKKTKLAIGRLTINNVNDFGTHMYIHLQENLFNLSVSRRKAVTGKLTAILKTCTLRMQMRVQDVKPLKLEGRI